MNIQDQERDYEIDNRTSVNHEGPDANKPIQRLTATSIIGDSVENAQGEDLGKIENLMININKTEVEYAVIEFGSFLGMGGKLFAIPFKELKPNPAKKGFILNRNKEYLKKYPGFDKTHWPDTNDDYFKTVEIYHDSFPPFP